MTSSKKAFIMWPMFNEEGLFRSRGFVITKEIKEADIVVLTGGEDINPALYGHPRHHTVYYNVRRDEAELRAIDVALSYGIPMVGLCRGAQLLNVVCGGTLAQDVSMHTSSHNIITNDGEEVMATSAHHQMLRPTEESKTLAVSVHPFKATHWDGEKFVTETVDHCPEIVYYEKFKALCVQPHPEFQQGNPIYEPLRDLVFSYINRFFFKECF